MIHLCQDENQLYKNFFSRNSIFFEWVIFLIIEIEFSTFMAIFKYFFYFRKRNFMEELCMLLYDRLRPIIIQVAHIETLAELCSILKTEILMENVKKNGKNKHWDQNKRKINSLVILFF